MLNPAFTIQIFAHLFHFINMYSFNWLVTTEGNISHFLYLFAAPYCLFSFRWQVSPDSLVWAASAGASPID